MMLQGKYSRALSRHMPDLSFGSDLQTLPSLKPPTSSPSIPKHYYGHNQTSQQHVACMRQCCRIKELIKERNRREVLKRKQILQSRISHRNVSKQKQSLEAKDSIKGMGYSSNVSRLKKSGSNKQKRIVLPRLKQFNVQEIMQGEKDHQSSHKVKPLIKRQLRLMTQASPQLIVPSFSFEKTSARYSNHSHSEDKSHRTHNQSYIQLTPITLPKKWNKVKERATTEQTQDLRDSRPYYKYLENYSKDKQTQTNQEHRKRAPTQSERSHSILSSFHQGTNKDNNTIFHCNKLKLSIRIPQSEQEIQTFLKQYNPIDRTFSVKQLVKKPKFQICKSSQIKQNWVYFGQLTSDNRKEGLGILINKSQLFEGEFKNNQKKSGSQKSQAGIYSGYFKDNLRQGKGTFKWPNGQQYQGEWKKGKKQGHGIWKSTKGDYYQGSWQGGNQQGKGVYFHVGGSQYTGYFKECLKDGRGEELFENGDKYSGQYRRGKPHGYGKYVWANGDIYEGMFQDGSRQGQGQLTKSIGEAYRGEFKADMKCGKGTEKYASGEYFKGLFEDGQKISGSLYAKDGTLLEQL